MTARLFQLFLPWVGALCAATANAADLTVRIPQLPSTEGQIRVALFDSPADFPRKMLRGELVDAKASPLAAVFKQLPPGRYAVSAYQDLNANAKLDTGPMGRPVEPMGFSRDARGTFGPPSFDDAAFSIEASDLTIDLTLR